MADKRHQELARLGAADWNRWRRDDGGVAPDLARADLAGAVLEGADLSYANLFAADLTGARLDGADLSSANLMYALLVQARLDGADLRQANLFAADLSGADLSGARLSGAHAAGARLRGTLLEGANLFVADFTHADLTGARLAKSNFFGSLLGGSDFSGADCRGADFSGADLTGARLDGADLSGATLSDCRVRSVSAAGVKLGGAIQKDLVLSAEGEPEVAVDGLDNALALAAMAEGSGQTESLEGPAVLFLGAYPHERKGFLNAIREEARKAGFVPLLLDLEGGGEPVLTIRLARLSRFVLADLGGLVELPAALSDLVAAGGIMVRPILAGPAPAGICEGLAGMAGHDSLGDLYQTDDQSQMIMSLGLKVFRPMTG
ncbi:MAG: pentapeptide repeat-containing protein [Gaiellales bacterium]|nr:MAG: pentapeptide repeat-containing protein [Gaiellales bacterium]